MASNFLIDSVDSDVFFVEQHSKEPNPQRDNSPNFLNSTELWGIHAREMPTNSSVASPEPDTVTLDDDSNEPKMPYGFGRQLPIIPPSLNDLNLPPDPFNTLAAMAVVNQEDDYVENSSPQSQEPSQPSRISTPPMNVSTIDGWETPHTTTDDNTFHSDDEPGRIYILPSVPTPPPPPPKAEK